MYNNIENVEFTLETIPIAQNEKNAKISQENEEKYNLIQLFKSIPFPTTDQEVKIKLRQLGEPIILFGEKNYERVERLKNFVEVLIIKSKCIPENIKNIFNVNEVNKNAIKEQKTNKIEEEFYTEGTDELLKLRQELLLYSIPRSSYRLLYEKQRIANENFISFNKEIFPNYEFCSSQIADSRGCSRGTISPDDKIYGVAGWSGECTLLDVKTLNILGKLKGHTSKVNSLIFSPGFNKDNNLILTASSDNTIKLWDYKNNESKTLKGHEDKVNYAEFHPNGNLIGSCSNDLTIRFWDIIKQKEIYLQEGHSYSITSLSFQGDGALLASSDLGGIGLVWDLRSGKSIRKLIGHAKEILKIKFLKNCYTVATASGDHLIYLWDLRKEKKPICIPAHNDIVCDLQQEKSEPFSSKFTLSCSFDSTIKMWDNNWNYIHSFSAMEGDKFMSVDITKNGENIIATCLGKNIKMWKKI